MRVEGARTLVTGGAGFIGSWLCERLLAEGALVWCVDSFVTGSPDKVAHLGAHPGFVLVEADVATGVPDPGHLDLVVHLAGHESPAQHPRGFEAAGAASRGTVSALELAERHRARFVLASGGRFAEATAMTYHRSRGVDIAIARLFDTYGPRMRLDDGRPLATLVRQAVRGEPVTVPGDGAEPRDLCWVEDTVDGLVRLARSTVRGPVSLGGDAQMPALELARTVLTLAGSPSEIRHVDPPADPPSPGPDIGYARRALGWEPAMAVEEGLKQTLRWAEEQLL
jgi:dTDP-glucose 4,6-dehydratase